jgi:hypothetical protein
MSKHDNMLLNAALKNQETTTNAWWQCEKLLESNHYDTDTYWFSQEDYQKLLDASKSLGLELGLDTPRTSQNDSK